MRVMKSWKSAVLLGGSLLKCCTSILWPLPVFVIVLCATRARAQTEAWPQYSRYLDYSKWFSADRSATASMVIVKGGDYTVGTDAEEIAEFCRQAGVPNPPPGLTHSQFAKRRVHLQPFYILDHEVSNKEYLEFLDATAHRPPHIEFDMEDSWAVNQIFAWRGRSYPPGRAGFPVTGITKSDAEAFCAWRTQATGVVHRLPTEEEWEAAYRGKESIPFPWGVKWDGPLRIPIGRHMHVGPDPFYAPTDDRTPTGIKFLLGGVKEFTATVTDEEETVIRGAAYDSVLNQVCPVQLRTLGARDSNPCESDEASYNVGFRYVIQKSNAN